MQGPYGRSSQEAFNDKAWGEQQSFIDRKSSRSNIKSRDQVLREKPKKTEVR